LERVLRRDDVMPVMAKLVVVACEVVALVAVKLPKVEEALVSMPPVKVERLVTESELSVAKPDVVRVPNVAPPTALN